MGVTITSDNPKLRPFRHALTQIAMESLSKGDIAIPFAGKHVPVRLQLEVYLKRPPSTSKKRLFPVVKPDADKLLRATLDAFTGVLYADDAQVVEASIVKRYGTPERVEVHCRQAAVEAAATLMDWDEPETVLPFAP